jgi:(E)-4-hydroxy-3-methylbut-2-enyl-diphosphate synthase
MVGDVGIGGNHPIRIQSMTTTDTLDTVGTVRQVIQLYEAGCEIVRVTAPSIKEAENLKEIRTALRREGVQVPLVADIHFTPNAALKAADYVEKVRINPGNFADKKKFAVREYSDAEYQQELERIEETFRPLVLKCKQNGVALRIGTNHGSLSDRIMNRFGDTPAGMVESALEFVHMCERHNFRDIVLSMKSSNPQVMIAAYRLLAARMYELGMDYPFHLGVTEAGDGEDGRIKSAVGIGTLLEDGLGDTIRVSLTEDSVHEIRAGRSLAHKFHALRHPRFLADEPLTERPEQRNPYSYRRRWSQVVELASFHVGGVHAVRVEAALHGSDVEQLRRVVRKAALAESGKAEIIRLGPASAEVVGPLRDTVDREGWPVALSVECTGLAAADAVVDSVDIIRGVPDPSLDRTAWMNAVRILVTRAAKAEKKAVQFDLSSVRVPGFLRVAGLPEIESLVETAKLAVETSYEEGFRNCSIAVRHPNLIAVHRQLAAAFTDPAVQPPFHLVYDGGLSRCAGCETLFEASAALGSLLCDGIGDAVCLDDPALALTDALRMSYNLLQATRLRISKTEFISCPSCGRTLFDLQEVTSRIKARTGHLKGVKIAIMGCIVNGPGEMADADFGYVGASAGRINLYVGKDLVERNIPMAEADDRLIALIKKEGRWTEP